MPESICPDCETHDDGGFTCDPKRAACPYEPVKDAWPLYEYQACPVTREPHRWALAFHKVPTPSPRDECQNCGALR